MGAAALGLLACAPRAQDDQPLTRSPEGAGLGVSTSDSAAGIDDGGDTAFAPGLVRLRAGGDEPFWLAEASDGWLVFERAGLPSIEARHEPTDFATSPIEVRAGELEMVLTRAACVREMSGLTFEWTATVTFEGDVFEGCADMPEVGSAPGPGVAARGLAAEVAAAASVLRACLGADLGAAPQRWVVRSVQPGPTLALVGAEGALAACGPEGAIVPGTPDPTAEPTREVFVPLGDDESPADLRMPCLGEPGQIVVAADGTYLGQLAEWQC
jgi:uncharacterized membrane protein